MQLIINPRTRAPQLPYGQNGFYPVRNGEVLQNRYGIWEFLGNGGFATAYRAMDWQTNRTVAVKIFRCGEGFNAASKKEIEYVRKIAEEIPEQSPHSVSPLGSNNIVSLTADFQLYGPYGQHDVMVMELLGPDLCSILYESNQQVLTPHRIKSFSKNILEGLHFLHVKCKIMHLDLKPDNLFVTVDPENMNLSDPNCKARLKIGDFSTSHSTETVIFDTVQVPSYRAPESFLKSRIGTATDMWSVGCIIFEMATREQLFPHTNEDRDERWYLCRIAALFGKVERMNFEEYGGNTDVFRGVFGSSIVCNGFPLAVNRISLTELMKRSSMDQSDAENLQKLLVELLKIRPFERPAARFALQMAFFNRC